MQVLYILEDTRNIIFLLIYNFLKKSVRWCLFITFVDFTIFTDFVSTKVPQISDFFEATFAKII